MGEFFEIFSNGARHAREQRDFDKVHVVQAKRGGTGPQPLDLESGRILLVHPGEQVAADGPVLRVATEADHPRLSRLAIRAWLDASGMHHADPRLDVVRDMAGRRAAGEQVLVLLQERRPVAVAAWAAAPGGGTDDAARGAGDPAVARLTLLAVDPAQQRRGFGALLVAAVADAAADAGHRRLVAETEDWMGTARAVFRTAGFQRHGATHVLELSPDES